MSEQIPEEKSASEKMVAMLNDLIESCPGEGKPEKLAFVITGLVFASKLSIKSFDQVVRPCPRTAAKAAGRQVGPSAGQE